MTFRIALLNFKGGVGKTSSSAALAHCAAADGYRVLLLDADPQASLLDWSELAASLDEPWAMPVEAAATPRFDELAYQLETNHGSPEIVITDGPPSEGKTHPIAEAMVRWADLVIVPSAPTPRDLPRTATTRQFIAERRHDLDAPVLMTRVDTRTSASREMDAWLEANDIPSFDDWIPVRQAIAAALTRPHIDPYIAIWKTIQSAACDARLIPVLA